MAYHVYISNAASAFSHFIMDESSGRLQPQADIQLPAEPGAVAVSPDQSHMFVALRSAKYLASYRIDAASGQLTQVSTSGQEEGPPYLYVDKTGRFLLSSTTAVEPLACTVSTMTTAFVRAAADA